jgi:hypothetical protein
VFGLPSVLLWLHFDLEPFVADFSWFEHLLLRIATGHNVLFQFWLLLRGLDPLVQQALLRNQLVLYFLLSLLVLFFQDIEIVTRSINFFEFFSDCWLQ